MTIAIRLCLLSGCSTAQQLPAKQQTQPERKVLIVYLSRTNNTKAVAEFIHNEVGGTIVALELEKPYPEDYRPTVDQVVRESVTEFCWQSRRLGPTKLKAK